MFPKIAKTGRNVLPTSRPVEEVEDFHNSHDASVPIFSITVTLLLRSVWPSPVGDLFVCHCILCGPCQMSGSSIVEHLHAANIYAADR